MVRLKDNAIWNCLSIVIIFQFLMVRLKDFIFKLACRCNEAFQFLMVRLKVQMCYIFARCVTRFQFLMVRLKEWFVEFTCMHTNISIPYGAIKSNSSNVIFFHLFIFQFLMVRLKESNGSLLVYSLT